MTTGRINQRNITMLVSDWIRAGVAGSTIDGREITESHIDEAGTAYNQSVYNARIWPEHVRGMSPGGLFKALGDVVAVKSERIKEGTMLDGKLALFVKIAPVAELIEMVRRGEKVHLSMELDSNFAKTGKAYLVGLGVTDSPASLGTGIMRFSTAERAENLFSDFQGVEIAIHDDGGDSITREDARVMLNAALSPLVSRLGALSGNAEALTQQADELIELATPPAGSDPHQKHHAGGDPESKRYRGY